MIWAQSLSITEIVFIGLFVGLYALYIARIARIATALKTPFVKVAVKLILRTSYFMLFIVALLGPSFGQAAREVQSVGKDIFVCVDLSGSMDAFDVQPTRLAKVKFELKNLVEAFNSDRIGLIMFSNEAFMQCPLTYDNNALNLFIQSLSTSLVPNSGTDFGPPLEMALEKLESEESSVTRQTSKIIILISDGEDFGDDTEQIAQEIQSAGIKLFSLGVGTEAGSKIETRRGYKKDRGGQDVITKLNSSSLRKLASDTDGKYFEINKKRNDMSRLMSAIEDIEGELRDSKQMDAASNKYFYFLAIALLLMFVDMVSNVSVIRI
jgi:Ca-activated chloride channel family protein